MFNRENANKRREELADVIVEVAAHHKHLVIELPTGTGKGLICARIMAGSTSKKKWLVVVPEIAQVENYKQDLIKHGNQRLLEERIEEVICYASLKKYQDTSFNVHLNECHRVSDARMDYLGTIDFDQVISDSATISQEIKERLETIWPFHLYQKSLQDIIDMGILPEPVIEVVAVPLSDVDGGYTAIYGKKYVNKSSLGMYEYLNQQIKYWEDRYKSSDQQWQYNKWMQAAGERKRFMAQYKTFHARKMIDKMGGKRMVCFCGSIEQAEELGGRWSIHSRNSKKENQEVIDSFNSKSSNHLYTCMMGVEGMNFTDIDCAILVQLDNVDRLPLQKTGRALRSDIPELYVLYIPNTQDEKYLNKFLKNFNPKYIKGYEQKEEQQDSKVKTKTGIQGKKRV